MRRKGGSRIFPCEFTIVREDADRLKRQKVSIIDETPSLGGICSTRKGNGRWTKRRWKMEGEREAAAPGKRARFDSRAPRVLLIYSSPAIRD